MNLHTVGLVLQVSEHDFAYFWACLTGLEHDFAYWF